MGVAVIMVTCPGCGAQVEVEVTLRALQCDCTDADRHAHVLLRHNAEEALILHRGSHVEASKHEEDESAAAGVLRGGQSSKLIF